MITVGRNDDNSIQTYLIFGLRAKVCLAWGEAGKRLKKGEEEWLLLFELRKKASKTQLHIFSVANYFLG